MSQKEGYTERLNECENNMNTSLWPFQSADLKLSEHLEGDLDSKSSSLKLNKRRNEQLSVCSIFANKHLHCFCHGALRQQSTGIV